MGQSAKSEKKRIKQQAARRRRRIRMLVAAAVILPFLAGGVYALVAWSSLTGKPAYDFALPDQDGRKVRLADFRGKQEVALVFYMVAT
jgi:cytochrome oxidase Cu insertion factor (SCO1/SenC/PrrC family)